MRVRLPPVVDAFTAADLPVGRSAPDVVVDFGDCRLFGAAGFGWLAELLAAGCRVTVVEAPARFAQLVEVLLPARVEEGRLVLVE